MWKAIIAGLIVCVGTISAMQKPNKHKKTQSNLDFLAKNGKLNGVLGQQTVEKLARDASLSEEEKKKEEQFDAYTPKTMGKSWKAAYEQQQKQPPTEQAITTIAVKNVQNSTSSQVKEKVVVDCCC